MFPGGILVVYMTGGSDLFFLCVLKVYTLGILLGSRDLSRIFLGLQVCLIEKLSSEVFNSCIFGGYEILVPAIF